MISKRALRRSLRKRKSAHKRRCFIARRTARRKFVTDTGNTELRGPVFKWLKKGEAKPSENFRAALRKADNTYTVSHRETGERLLETLVPGDSYDNESPDQAIVWEETGVRVGFFLYASGNLWQIDLCSVEEFKAAIWRMAPNMSPGRDGITARILRHAWPVLKEHITNVLINCPRTRKFPDTWKNARLVVSRKSPEKDPKILPRLSHTVPSACYP